MSLASMEDDSDICPISLECGLVVPRRSIDYTSSKLHLQVAAPHEASGAARRACSDIAPAGPFSSPTPAEHLTADGRLDLSTMMEQSQQSQASNHSLHRMASLRGFSRAASGRVSQTAAASASGSDAAKALAAAAATHTSCDAAGKSSSLGSPISSPQNSMTCQRQADPAGLDCTQLTDQQQRLASACRNKDTKLLQQALAAGAPVSAALDAKANTALHLLLLPMSNTLAAVQTADATAQHAVSTTGSAAELEQQPSMSGSNGRSGALSWLTGCFGGSSNSNSQVMAAASPSGRSVSGRGCLSPAAAAAAQVHMAAALLAAGANVNVRNRDGLTPVMLAVRQVVIASSTASSMHNSTVGASLKVLEQLCKDRMADMNMKDAAGRTALALLMLPANHPTAATAGTAGKGCALAATAAAGASTSDSSGSAASARILPLAPTAPSAAAAAAQIKVVQLLVHYGADINAADAAGMTPLIHAAAQPGVTKELLQKLLELGANPRLLDNQRRSALTHAMMAQQLKLVPALGSGHEKWYKLNNSNTSTTSARSAAAGPASCSSSGCIATAPDPAWCINSCSIDLAMNDAASDANSNNSSPSSGSQEYLKPRSFYNPFPLPNHGNVIRALCSYGSLDLFPGTINTRFPAIDGYSQLHIAMRRGDQHALDMLIASGADVNALDSYGNSPLMYWPVAPTEPEELVYGLAAALLGQGADPNISNNDGWTPLDFACDLNKLGKVIVKPECVPVHALLVGYGGKNSEAFINQRQHQPALLCMRTDSANSVLRSKSSFDSLRAGMPPSLGDPVLLPASVVEEEF